MLPIMMSQNEGLSSSSSSSSGPTLDAIQCALEEVSKSIQQFSRAHSKWFMYHQSCFGIVGNAWQDYQGELANHTDAIRGLKALRTNIQKEVQWIEKHSAQVGLKSIFSSSNAFYLSTYWQQILYSALHQSPVMELDASMAIEKGKSRAKSTKVDIVCEGGRKWIRISTIKPISLLSEFRNAESYIIDDESEVEEGEEAYNKSKLTLEMIEEQLTKGKVDAIANQCSLIRIARDLNKAAGIAQNKSAWGRPIVEIVFTRLNQSDSSDSLMGKFYNQEEKDRFEKRLHALIVEMGSIGLTVRMRDDRQLFENKTLRAALPSSLASGGANNYNKVTPLPLLSLPPNAPSTRSSTTINLDLSALVALVSQISHIRKDDLLYQDDFNRCFRKDHWKVASLQSKRNLEGEEIEAGDGEKSVQTQHTRALSDQLEREFKDERFFETILSFVGKGDKIKFVCTTEAMGKFNEILALVGGATEQQRGIHLFQFDGQDAFWSGSKWERTLIRERIMLPVEAVDYIPAEAASTCNVASDTEFRRIAKTCILKGLGELRNPSIVAPPTRSHMTGTGIQRQTIHTLSSMLYGLESKYTTLTTNTASIKWLARDVNRFQSSEASLVGYVPIQNESGQTSAILLYPRSLAEKMMIETPIASSNVMQKMLPYSPGIDNLITSTDALYSSNIKDRFDSFGTTDLKSYSLSTSTPKESIPFSVNDLVTNLISSPTRQGRCLKASASGIRRWIRGPRPRITLVIKHYRWWPLQPIEEAWLRWTSRLAWKDYQKSTRGLDNDDVEGDAFTAVPLDSSFGEEEREILDRDAWFEGIRKDWRLNRLHWIFLALTFVSWAFAFTFLVKDLWYDATVMSANGTETSPTFYGCTTTFWLGNADCGLNGAACSPFSAPDPIPFRCPASCDTTTLGGRRAVGDQLPNFVTLVVGGGPQGNSSSVGKGDAAGPLIYRGDSFVCSAAIHAGVMTRQSGGCSNLILNGAYSGYQGIERNGIQSTSFNSSFPSSFYFDSTVTGKSCTDRRYRGYILDVITLAWVSVLQPKGIVYFFTLIVVGFWHINFISEPRKFPMSVGDPMGDFLPTLFVAYGLWRVSIRFIWPAFDHLPLERNIWIQAFFWIGVLLNVVFQSIPLQRLVGSDIRTQPGALTALIIIIIIVIFIVINQIRVIRKVGQLPKYLSIAVIGAIIIGLLAAIPTTGFRLHHYIIAMILLPFCAFQTRLSLIYSSFLLGMFLNGVGRWGYDGIIQDVAVIIGSGLTGSTLPVFLAASNWTGVPAFNSTSNISTGLVHWQDIPSNQTDEWDSFALLVDDVLRLQSSQTHFNISQLSQYYLDTPAALDSTALVTTALPYANLSLYPGGNDTSNVDGIISSQPHYLRLSYYNTNTGSYGDFTKAATLYFNGTFISPADGST